MATLNDLIGIELRVWQFVDDYSGELEYSDTEFFESVQSIKSYLDENETDQICVVPESHDYDEEYRVKAYFIDDDSIANPKALLDVGYARL